MRSPSAPAPAAPASACPSPAARQAAWSTAHAPSRPLTSGRPPPDRALHYACGVGSDECVKTLLTAGTEVDAGVRAPAPSRPTSPPPPPGYPPNPPKTPAPPRRTRTGTPPSTLPLGTSTRRSSGGSSTPGRTRSSRTRRRGAAGPHSTGVPSAPPELPSCRKVFATHSPCGRAAPGWCCHRAARPWRWCSPSRTRPRRPPSSSPAATRSTRLQRRAAALLPAAAAGRNVSLHASESPPTRRPATPLPPPQTQELESHLFEELEPVAVLAKRGEGCAVPRCNARGRLFCRRRCAPRNEGGRVGETEPPHRCDRRTSAEFLVRWPDGSPDTWEVRRRRRRLGPLPPLTCSCQRGSPASSPPAPALRPCPALPRPCPPVSARSRSATSRTT